MGILLPARMPPRIHPPSKAIASILRSKRALRIHRQYATAAAITPAASHEQMTRSATPIARYPSTQPPSYKPPEFRKSQLLRQYASLLRSTPLMLLFQHNNLKSMEWVGIRRELAKALQKVDEARVAAGHPAENSAEGIKIQIIQTGLQKLLLLGARVEGKVFDIDGTKWVGGIEGGLEGLQAQLVSMLQGFGAGLTNTLESAGKSLYFTVEGRRTMLEDEEKGVSEPVKEETKAE